MNVDEIIKHAPIESTGYIFLGGVLFYILDKGEERFVQSKVYPYWQKVNKYDLDIQPIKQSHNQT
ncbi:MULTISPECIES: hypothetical protein [Acinetobacter]|uniref:Uncharacterized protein n=1 Tax=Acinetobacter higginsii TaxID=70347 RepID=N9SNG7_9GAMM|nr:MULTISPECIES: hypothetical protein [Acinetobacter]ENX56171.1 hypothetical protein F902_03268 [Acinetobacter higginsii]